MKRRDWLLLAGSVFLPGCAGPRVTQSVSRSGGADAGARIGMGGAAFGIWRGGKLISGRGLDSRLPSLSITKTVAALAVARAVDEGWLSLDESAHVPEWSGDPAKRSITVRMLVNQSAGLAAGVPQLYRGSIPDKGRRALALPVVDAPGTRFRYGPAGSEALAEIMHRRLAARGSSLDVWMKRLLRRLRLSTPRWRADGRGHPYFSTGAEFSVRELGKLGRTIASLASGSNTSGISASVFRDLSSPRAANPMVAAGIWWNRNAARAGAFPILPERELDDVRAPGFWHRACLSPAADPGWLALIGSGGKRVYVLPEHDLVAVRLGRAAGWDDAAALHALSV